MLCTVAAVVDWEIRSLAGEDVAGLIAEVMEEGAAAIEAAADRVETDAYTIQARSDPRRRWAGQPIADRQGRLERAKAASAAGSGFLRSGRSP